MAYTSRPVDVISTALLLAATLGGIVTYPALPEQTAIHFTAIGTPNNYVPRYLAVILLPGIMLATLQFLRYAPSIDPRFQGTSDLHVLNVTTLATMALLTALHAIVLGWNLGHHIDMTLVLGGILIWAAALVAYSLWKDRLS